jgi:hypothetical protein
MRASRETRSISLRFSLFETGKDGNASCSSTPGAWLLCSEEEGEGERPEKDADGDPMGDIAPIFVLLLLLLRLWW